MTCMSLHIILTDIIIKQTVSDVCLKRTCWLDTSAFSTLEILDDNRVL